MVGWPFFQPADYLGSFEDNGDSSIITHFPEFWGPTERLNLWQLPHDCTHIASVQHIGTMKQTRVGTEARPEQEELSVVSRLRVEASDASGTVGPKAEDVHDALEGHRKGPGTQPLRTTIFHFITTEGM